MSEELTTLTSTTAKPLVDVFSLEEPFQGGDKLYASEMNQIVNEIQGALEYDTDKDSGTVTILGFRGCPLTDEERTPDSMIAFNAHRSVTILNIPEEIEGYPVTGIAAYAFAGCDKLVKVKLPSGLTTIGEGAFSGCSSFESITLPFIGGSATATSASRSTVFGYIFGTLSYTGGSATNQLYNYQSNYETYYIPQTLKSVTITGGNLFHGAFSRCTGLKNITIPDGAESIDPFAFYGCKNLTSITIPDSVTSIDERAFYGCDSLTSVTIPNSVKSIGDWTFNGCTNLTSVAIPDSVTSIGSAAFYSCDSLTSVTIPDSVTRIDSYAFSDCTSLTSVTIGNGVTSIGMNAFDTCDSLISITASADVFSLLPTEIRKKLVTVVITSGDIQGESFYVENQGNDSLTSVTIGNGVTSIGSDAFMYCTSLTNVTIGNSVTSIGRRAFEHCRNLTSVTIGNSVTSIDDEAFKFCYSLTSVTIPNSVTRIGYQAFYNCTSLKSVTIPNSVTSIGEHAFSGCTDLMSVTFYSNYSNTSLVTIAAGAFRDCRTLSSVKFIDEHGAWRICPSAFQNCNILKLDFGSYNSYTIEPEAFADNPISYIKDRGSSISLIDYNNLAANVYLNDVFKRIPFGATIYAEEDSSLDRLVQKQAVEDPPKQRYYLIDIDTDNILLSPTS